METTKATEEVTKIINLMDEDTYIDTLSVNFPEAEQLAKGAEMFLAALEIEGEDDQENIENAFIRQKLAQTLCNSIHFAAKATKTQLENALDGLSEAERESIGTEISESKLEAAIKKVEGCERRIAKYRQIYSVIAFEVFPEEMDRIITVLPDYYSQNICRKFEPWQNKQSWKKQQDQKQLTFSKVHAEEKLKKYGRA